MKVKLLQRWNGLTNALPHEVGEIVEMPDYIAEYMLPAGVCTADLTGGHVLGEAPVKLPDGPRSVALGALVEARGGTVDTTTLGILGVTAMNADDAIAAAELEESVEQLKAWREEEAAGKGRKTVLAALDERLEEFGETASSGTETGTGSAT